MNRDKFTIAVVGMGAVGVSMVAQLVKSLREKNVSGIRILGFERAAIFGPGIAYQQDTDSVILNRTSANMSAISGEPSHFVQWLTAAGYPASDHHDYLPRHIFGRYLRSTLQTAREEAEVSENEIILCPHQVLDIEHTAGSYVVSCAERSWSADRVILCTGNLKSRHYSHLQENRNYFASPYPLQDLLRRIRPDQTIAIIGSRLSAVDAVINIVKNGHTGPLVMLSRQGYLPSVQFSQCSSTLSYCTRHRIEVVAARSGGRLSYRTVIRLVLKELSCGAGRRFSVKRQKPSKGDAVAIFRRDIEEAALGPQGWQSAFVALNEVISDLWRLLSPADRKLFRSRDFSRFMALRVPIPGRNAKLLLELFDSGQLRLRSGLRAIQVDGQRFAASFNGDGQNAEPVACDVVINCTGADNDVAETSDPLYQHLRASGLITPDPFGGVAVDFDTNVAISRDGSFSRGLYVIGNLTSGAHLFCSVLELNTKHCRSVCSSIVTELQMSRQSVKRRSAAITYAH